MALGIDGVILAADEKTLRSVRGLPEARKRSVAYP